MPCKKTIYTLNAGERDAEGNIAVIAAGTGLGEGGLVWAGERHVSIASEGGHSTFSHNGDLEADLGRYLQKQFDHVSWERIVSGPGLASIYDFLCERQLERQSAWIREALTEGDRSNIIANAALEEQCELAGEAMDLFIYLYGCEAGNTALKFMSTRGLYIGGGVAPKIIARLQHQPLHGRIPTQGAHATGARIDSRSRGAQRQDRSTGRCLLGCSRHVGVRARKSIAASLTQLSARRE